MNLEIERAACDMDWYWHEDGKPSGADVPTGMVHREDCPHFDEETWTWWAEVTRLTPRLLALPAACVAPGRAVLSDVPRRRSTARGADRGRPSGRATPAPAYREQHAGHERRAVVGVVADRQASDRSCRAAPPGARPSRAAAPSAPGCRRPGRRARPRRRRCVVGSSPQSFDAAAIRCAVSIAVPDGASIFWSWCSSMISALSKYGAASSAKRIISTAPIAKFGAITALADDAAKRSRELGELVLGEAGRADDRVHAVLRAPAQVLAAASITVKSTATSAPASSSALALRRDLDLRAVHAELIEVDAGVMRVDRGDELHVGRVEHGLAHRRAHAPAGTEHPDADHRGKGTAGAVQRGPGSRELARLVRADDRERARRVARARGR